MSNLNYPAEAPRRFAHRGVAQAAPENTLGAFEAAAALGLEGIELDLHLSRDGVPVVIHDDNLTRLTCGHPTGASNGLVAQMSWEELARAELPYANHLLDEATPEGVENEFLALLPGRVLGQEFNRSYAAALQKEPRMAKLLRLEDFLRWFAASAPATMQAELELCCTGLVRPVFELLQGCAAAERCIVFSGHPGCLMELQSAAAFQGVPAGVKLGANLRALDEDTKEDIDDMTLYEVGLNAHCFSAEDVAWLAERDIRVLANLGDYPAWWGELRGLGVYGFKTNYAAAYTKWHAQNLYS
jgi:glycerophosphoryl diester phosphodiesterase